MIAQEGSTSLHWQKVNAERTDAVVQLGEARNFTGTKNDHLDYILIKPLNYDPDKEYPLVVCLPFGGYQCPPSELLTSEINRKNYPAFIMVPKCPEGQGWGGIPNYPTIDTLVFETIEALDKEFSIDVKRHYVTGVSRGGYGSWHFILTRPDLFAAAVPICGAGNPNLAANITQVSVWAFHGANDKNVFVSGSRDMIAAITKAGGNPKYTEYDDEAHNIWHRVSSTPDLLDWLFAQRLQ